MAYKLTEWPLKLCSIFDFDFHNCSTGTIGNMNICNINNIKYEKCTIELIHVYMSSLLDIQYRRNYTQIMLAICL